ncbi:hypothetical protein GCM10027422_48710 [Hymenobacter arcticus]
MAYSYEVPQQYPADVHALLAANRLEARPRSPEFNRALRAEVRDATWLLARQWQLHEFRAEDRGAPAFVDLTLQELPLARLAVGSAPDRAYDPRTQPLEAAVEAQPRPIGLGLRLQMGQYWRRQLRAALVQALPAPPDYNVLRGAASLFSTAFGLAPTAASVDPVAFALEATAPEALALLALVGPAAIDGYALYQALTTADGVPAQLAPYLADSDQLALALPGVALAPGLYKKLGVSAIGQLATAPLEVELQRFVLAFHRLYLLGHESTGWATEDLAYSFAVGTAGGLGLGASHYGGGGTLPWYAVDAQAPPANTPAAPAATTRRLLPTQVQFAGAPATRWWEFEDRRVDFGQVTGDASDWGRLLLQEFMFLYQNDWFSVPYTVQGGSVCRLSSVQVTDVFGRCYQVQPAGAGQLQEADGTLIDNDAGHWRLFAQTDAANPYPTTAAPLYLPATVRSPLVSRPVEQVSFRREEATNLVWAVESMVPDGFAGGLDGASAAAQVAETLRMLVPEVPAALADSAAPAYTYQLAGAVPENWIPFVPSSAGAPGLEQAVLHRQGLTLSGLAAEVLPRTGLLQLRPGQAYPLHEHEVPPTGVRVEGLNYRARWHDGRTLNWFGRQRGPAQLSGASGLAFDQLVPGQKK